MDPKLSDAALRGDVKFLRKAVAVQPPEYFLTQEKEVGNIFHLAAVGEMLEFWKEAMKILPTDILKQLLQGTDRLTWTLLHRASLSHNVSIFKFIIEMYKSLSWDDEDHVKPWLALSLYNETPLNLALTQAKTEYEECVMEILLMDRILVSWTIPDNQGNTPLYYAITNGFNRVAKKILESPLKPTDLVCSSDFSALLSVATDCSEDVVRLLMQKSDSWSDSDSDHWFDNYGNTILHSALNSTKNEEHALEILSKYPAMCKIFNHRGESPLFLAVKSGCERVVHKIMRIVEPRFDMLRNYYGTTVIHSLVCCSEKTGRRLLKKYWWIINLQDDLGKTALDYANEENVVWLVNLLTNPSLIEAEKEDFDWIEAFNRGEHQAVFAFVSNSQNLQTVCREANDTPLHHIVLPTYKDYLRFLKNPSIADIKNTTDHDGATALHRAIERKDMDFVKALLLDNGVERIIRDHAGRTAMDLLAMLCKDNDDWGIMCKQIKVNIYLRTTYIQPGTNLDQMRNTLSVIAALLATITFAAGFTLPGGINSNNGEAVLAKKPAFLVFLLADAYAMCTSMLVLFCLVWSMVSEVDMSRLLVDRSVFLLMQSLYATLLTFITGIYAVIEHSSLWAAIVVFVMCSTIAIAANQKILHKVIAKLAPTFKEVVAHVQRACRRLKDSILTLCRTVLGK